MAGRGQSCRDDHSADQAAAIACCAGQWAAEQTGASTTLPTSLLTPDCAGQWAAEQAGATIMIIYK